MPVCIDPKVKKENPYSKQESKFSPKTNPYDTILCIDNFIYLFQDESRFILQDDNEFEFNL